MSYAKEPNRLKRMIFNLLKKSMVQLAYSEPIKYAKSFDKDRFDFAFYDTKGRAYYSFKQDSNIAVIRKLYIAHKYIELVTGISETDLTESLNAILFAINETDKKERMKPNIARIGFICSKLLSRRNRLVNMETLYELCAIYFIREDEDWGAFDDVIQLEKVNCFKTELSEMVKEFFFEKSLNELFPFIESPEFFDSVLDEGKVELLAYLEHLKQYTNG